jgi:hypothetical protein
MEEKTMAMWKLKIKTKAELAKRKAVEMFKAGAKWVGENKELAMAGTAAGLKLVITLNKSYQARKESERRDCSLYDPRKGRYTITRRKPTAREEAEIDRRYNAGESYAHILDDMRLAK